MEGDGRLSVGRAAQRLRASPLTSAARAKRIMNTDQNHIKGLGKSLFQEAGDALFLFDPDTDRLLAVNPMAERLTGLTRAVLLAQPMTHWFRFAGKSGHRLRHAGSHTGVFHSQEGFLL